MEIQAIKKYMKMHKITYEELAQRTGLSISTIKKIFSGISQYPRVDTMQAIERALGLAPQWTDEEQAQGVSPAVILTDKENYRLTLLAEGDAVLGEKYVDTYLSLLAETIRQKKSK